MNQSQNWTLSHAISVDAPLSYLSASGTKAKGKGPFLSGTLKFKPGKGQRPGHVSGSFKAKFDGAGTKRFSTRALAQLSKS